MNGEVFSAWLRCQGHRVFETPSGYWYDAGFRFLQAFPYHRLITPHPTELERLLIRQHHVGLRFSAPIEYSSGSISYHAICCDKSYSLEKLERRSRQNVRKGLKNCSVKPISLIWLAEEGWHLQQDTTDRQNRRTKESRESWSRKYAAAGQHPAFEAWGALVGDRLAASILSFQIGDTVELISQQCRREFIPARVNHALAFTVTQALMQRPDVRYIFYTLQSLDARADIDDFKFRLGYSAAPVRQCVVFHPYLRPFAGQLLHAALKRASASMPSNTLISKGSGMIAFYLNGNRSLSEQEWPDCLRPDRNSILINALGYGDRINASRTSLR